MSGPARPAPASRAAAQTRASFASSRSLFFWAAWLLGPMMPPPQLTRAPSLYIACTSVNGWVGGGWVEAAGQGGGQHAAQYLAASRWAGRRRKPRPQRSQLAPALQSSSPCSPPAAPPAPCPTAMHGRTSSSARSGAPASQPPTLKDSTSLANSRWSSFFTAVSASAVAVFLCTTVPSRALPCTGRAWRQCRGAGQGVRTRQGLGVKEGWAGWRGAGAAGRLPEGPRLNLPAPLHPCNLHSPAAAPQLSPHPFYTQPTRPPTRPPTHSATRARTLTMQ